ncbi:Uncharacterised protein [uncultured archaeon]|nr:Uncharacterised protein [uncultured archaeon]
MNNHKNNSQESKFLMISEEIFFKKDFFKPINTVTNNAINARNPTHIANGILNNILFHNYCTFHKWMNITDIIIGSSRIEPIGK